MRLQDQRKTIETLSGLLAQDSQYKGRGDISFLIGGDFYMATETRSLGKGASADDVSYVNIWNELTSSGDGQRLSTELNSLRKALEGESKHEQADQVSMAEQEIARGNGAKALQYLKKAGAWALETATKIGTDVAAAAIKQSLGVK